MRHGCGSGDCGGILIQCRRGSGGTANAFGMTAALKKKNELVSRGVMVLSCGLWQD